MSKISRKLWGGVYNDLTSWNWWSLVGLNATSVTINEQNYLVIHKGEDFNNGFLIKEGTTQMYYYVNGAMHSGTTASNSQMTSGDTYTNYFYYYVNDGVIAFGFGRSDNCRLTAMVGVGCDFENNEKTMYFINVSGYSNDTVLCDGELMNVILAPATSYEIVSLGNFVHSNTDCIANNIYLALCFPDDIKGNTNVFTINGIEYIGLSQPNTNYPHPKWCFKA